MNCSFAPDDVPKWTGDSEQHTLTDTLRVRVQLALQELRLTIEEGSSRERKRCAAETLERTTTQLADLLLRNITPR